ncbi:hypothetical protein [Pedobacter sp. Leaf170]|uniref:hypothetical protein n=1 Tax=Pedobacter sp. Leaf170 TaxID=2876558 RepID=UPI001E587CB3|nr:hypothetical protein [Pedobacter sp. Leaf170]
MAKKPTVDSFKKVCEAKAGNISSIAKAFDVERKTVYAWMKGPKYKQAYDDVRESLLDFTESQQMILIRGLMKKDPEGNFIGWIERPSESMIIWFEKTRGKHRGLSDSKVEVEISEKADVPIKKWLEESRKKRAEKKKDNKK